jgi:hypothetical protein
MKTITIFKNDFNWLQQINVSNVIIIESGNYLIPSFDLFIDLKDGDGHLIYNACYPKISHSTYHMWTESNNQYRLNNTEYKQDLYIHDIFITKLPDSLKVQGTVFIDNILTYYPKHLTINPLTQLGSLKRINNVH